MTQSHQHPSHTDEPLPIEPGHVRQRQHYEAMLAQQQNEEDLRDQSAGAPP